VEQADLHSTISMSPRWNSGATFEDGLSVRALRTRASQYGSVSFANGVFGLAGGSEIVVPGAAIADALNRLGLLHAAQGYGGSVHFYAPANRMFLPAASACAETAPGIPSVNFFHKPPCAPRWGQFRLSPISVPYFPVPYFPLFPPISPYRNNGR
jgi:hypothetical protein